jgi:hypothetical protein
MKPSGRLRGPYQRKVPRPVRPGQRGTIGVLLILGLFTGAAAFAALTLNLVYRSASSAWVVP